MPIDRTIFTAEDVQRFLGVEPDGHWGPDTESAARIKLGFPKDDTGRPWGRKRLIIGVQQALMAADGINIVVDGLMGERTREAMELWQNRGKVEGMPKVVLAELTWWDRFRNWWKSDDAPSPKQGELPVLKVPGTHGLKRNEWPLQSEMEAFYGPKGENQTRIKLPYPVKLSWDKKTTLSTMVCHKLVADSVLRCLNAVHDHYGDEEIKRLGLDLFGGCLNVRKVRGGNSWSIHSWGAAIDWDPDRNQMRWDHTKARLAKDDAKAFWEIWEAEGWVSLGRARDYDWMHVQAARLR